MPHRPTKATLHAVLDQAVATLTDAGLTVPDRQYVAAGASADDVPWDCEQLAVVPGQIRRGQVAQAGPGPVQMTRQRGTAALVRVLDLELQLVRCYPTAVPRPQGRGVKLPTADELRAAGDILADDLDGIAAVLDACVADGLGFAPNMVSAGPVRAVGPIGGYAAVVGGLSITAMAVS